MASTEQPAGGYLRADAPIRGSAEDRLGRTRLADAIAAQVVNSPIGQGIVLGVVGRWGSGKTSVLNMVVERAAELDGDLVVLRFNPGMFSTADELVSRFLHELGAQLRERGNQADDRRRKDKLNALADRVLGYSESLEPLGWIPGIGAWLSRAGKLGKAVKEGRDKIRARPSVADERKAIEALLADLGTRILVVVDDMDRVDPELVRDQVRMVKLVADFPNVVYLLAYDRRHVEHALSRRPEDSVEDGREYLEKIVQAVHNIPPVSDSLLIQAFSDELELALRGIEHGPVDEKRLPDVFAEGIRPFLKTMRDITRFLNSAPVAVRAIEGEVDLVDVLGLEALRVFAPESWELLPTAIGALTGETSVMGLDARQRRDQDAELVKPIVETAGEHQEIVRALLARLFPRTDGLLTGRGMNVSTVDRKTSRVANADVLRVYLHRQLPEGVLSVAVVHRAFALLGDAEALTELISGMSPETFEELLVRFEEFSGEFDPSTVESAIEVLLNSLPRLREGKAGMFDFGADLQLTRVVLRMLRAVEGDDARLDLVKRVLPRLQQLSARKELIDLAGHRKNVGHDLIPANTDDPLYAELVEQLTSASTEQLLAERDLARVFVVAIDRDQDSGLKLLRDKTDDPRVFAQLLRSCFSEQLSQELGTRHVKRAPVLPWQTLVAWFGEEDLARRVSTAQKKLDQDSLDPRTQRALDTAAKYAAGEIKLDGTGWADDDDD